jgi:ParB family chromosome partitioning protein
MSMNTVTEDEQEFQETEMELAEGAAVIENEPTPVDMATLTPMDMPSRVQFIDPQDLVIDDEFNPRRFQVKASEVVELAKDIVSNGQIQPIVVRELGRKDGRMKYRVTDGRTRSKAILYANEHKMTEEPLKVAALVVEQDDAQAYITAIASFKRKDWTPIDKSNVIKTLEGEFGMKRSAIAEKLGIPKSSVTELAHLADLRPQIQKKINDGVIPYTAVRTLIGQSEEDQDEAIKELEQGGGKVSVEKREHLRAKKRAKGLKEGKELKASLTTKEAKKGFGELYGADLEKGVECKYSEGVQQKGKALVKFMEGKMGIKALANILDS